MTDGVTQAKLAAARYAVDLVEDGMVLGLGTGSTAEVVLDLLAERVRQGWRLRGVPTSEATAATAQRIGITLVSLDDAPRVDLTIDGADEVTPEFDLIKGKGGALLREKVVAQASTREVIVVDESKLVARLGEKAPLPVEVVPFAWGQVAAALRAKGGTVTLREGYRTDNGNVVLDWHTGPITDPRALHDAIHALAGVVEHGMFLSLATTVIIGYPDGSTDRRDRHTGS